MEVREDEGKKLEKRRREREERIYMKADIDRTGGVVK